MYSLDGADRVPRPSAASTLLAAFAALGRSFPAMEREAVLALTLWRTAKNIPDKV